MVHYVYHQKIKHTQRTLSLCGPHMDCWAPESDSSEDSSDDEETIVVEDEEEFLISDDDTDKDEGISIPQSESEDQEPSTEFIVPILHMVSTAT